MKTASSSSTLVAVLLTAAASLLGASATAQEVVVEKPAPPVVKLQTNVGVIAVELWPDKAPRTVNNFLKYVRTGFYNDTIFHRVVSGSVIQGGALTSDLRPKKARPPIPLENGGRHQQYTIAMARGAEPDTATCQFFINLVDNRGFDEAGYAVFGRVIKGKSVVNQIARVPVREHPPGFTHLPVTAVIIEEATILPPGEQLE